LAAKSKDAFRTISEVADWLDVPTHVLRFWESRFSQIKPVKRAGGRRYYRPSDMRLIGGVKVLLHDQGMTIRGVQKMLREQGIKHVSSFSAPLDSEVSQADDAGDDVIEHAPAEAAPSAPAPAARQTHEAAPAPEPEPEPDAAEPVPVSGRAPRPAPEPVATSPAPAAATDDTPEADDDQPDMFPDHDPAPATPLVPAGDVPDTDPDDQSDAHDATPGRAARLVRVAPSTLAAHRDALTTARDRLKALRDGFE